MENENDDQEWKGYVFAAGLFVVAMTQSIFFHQNFHFGMTTGMRIKSALIGSVYKKVNYCQYQFLTHLCRESKEWALANTADPDQMQHSVTSDQSLHHFAVIKFI